MAFAHLHLHSEYSLLDGAARIKPLVKKAKDLGFSSLAITDHGVMYGVVDFYTACKEAGLHPVIGCEVYVAPGSRFEKNSASREYAHLVLLCENQQGYQNLIKMVSLGFTEGYYYRPRIDMDLLEQYHEGLIALSACLSGDLPRLIVSGQIAEAARLAERFQAIMGKDHYFLELQDHGIQEQKQVNLELFRLSKELGIPLVATNDVHYIDQRDAKAQEVLMCIQTGKTLKDNDRMELSTDQFYLKSEAEMAALFPQAPEAITNTEKIAARCQVEFEFGHYHLPDFPVPNGEDHALYLRARCEEGIRARYGASPSEAVLQRMNYELGMIERCGYVDYFLIVWDFVRFAKESGIPVGPGRGSGAGSICAYALQITGIDPLEYGLIFERFLNPERVSMPDFDIDFCYERRQEVIDYVTRRYGKDRVSQIITFGTMAARAVVRDVARVLGLPYGTADQICKLEPFHQLGMTLEKAIEISAELRGMIENDQAIAELMDYAKVLEGMPRHASTHAAGVVIGARPLTDFIPLQMNDEVVTTQFPMGTIEKLGLLKMDFLGLKTLTILRDAARMIELEGGESVDLDQLDLQDRATYAMLAKADTDGVFQLESAGMRRVIADLEPESIEDLTAVISLYRPGPMEAIPRYIRGKKNPGSIRYESPILEKVLSVSYGCMVYQEQVMQIVRDMAGYSLGRSDIVRRAMSKKKKEEMDREQKVFVDGLVENGELVVPGAVRLGTSRELALSIFAQMESFAQYAFNKSHAAAYALIAYQTAYLKAHYPRPFLAACMNSALFDPGKLAGLIQYCKKSGIPVKAPDVNHSTSRFSVENGAILYGLSAVKNVGHAAVETLIALREQSPFCDVFDFCERVGQGGINKKAVESLIKAGALDSLPGSRAQKLAVFERIIDSAGKSAKVNVAGQTDLFGALGEAPSIKRALPDLPEHPKRALLLMEKETTGVYLSGHPLDEYREAIEKKPQNIRYLYELSEEEGWQRYDGQPFSIGVFILESRLKTTRSNALMCFLQVEDLYGTMEALVFPRVYERLSHYLQADSAVQITGRLSLREEREPSLIVESALPLALSAEKQQKLYLRLREKRQMDGVCLA
ncbi:MAG: DNA polymerase III subunit alpha, partial [Christensenellaceae bacterium]|nr:DNA polymerase III subunit alpha [Christensenellaceae bacterium]